MRHGLCSCTPAVAFRRLCSMVALFFGIQYCTLVATSSLPMPTLFLPSMLSNHETQTPTSFMSLSFSPLLFHLFNPYRCSSSTKPLCDAPSYHPTPWRTSLCLHVCGTPCVALILARSRYMSLEFAAVIVLLASSNALETHRLPTIANPRSSSIPRPHNSYQ